MKRPLPLVLFPYIAGIIIGSYYPLPFTWTLTGIMAGILAVVICLGAGRKKPALFFAPAIFVLFGILFIGRVLSPDFPAHHLIHFTGEKKFNIEGVLYQTPDPMPDKTRLYIRAERIHLEEGSFPVTGNILLTVRERHSGLRYGDRVRFISKLYLPRAATNPGAFDYRRFLALQGIWATAYAGEASEVIRLEERRGHAFFHFVEREREKIRVFFDRHAPPESRGIIKALVLGERGDISKEVNEKFIVSGVAHILSISGLHVALVAAFFFGTTRLALKFSPSLILRLDLNKVSALVAVIPVILYTFIAGLGVAAVRSMIMTLSFLLALLLDREKDLYDALFLAAFFILIFSPASLFDISFQLSFLSVLAILYLIPRFTEFFSFLKTWPMSSWVEEQSLWKRKCLFYLGGSLLTSAAAILGTGPLVVYYFNRVSLAGFISNLLLVPLMGFVNTLLSLIAAFLVFLAPPLAAILTSVNVFLLKISLAVVDLFSRLPMASKRLSTPALLEIVLLYGILILAANVKRWRRALPGVILLTGIYAGYQGYDFYSRHHGKELAVTFLDVGQGDAAVIRLPGGKTMVVDGGGSPDGSFDPGERIVAPFLWKEKIGRIDYLVNTHFHPDHLQGLLFLLENFPVGEIWYNGEGALDYPPAAQFLAAAGSRLAELDRAGPPREINGVKLSVLHPPEENPFLQGNNASLVLRLSYGEFSFLFSGDVESPAEEEILQTGSDLRSTVLKVPHHGSKTSSTLQFLEAIRPLYAVFTVKPGGRTRLPHPAVLERYNDLGVRNLRTDTDGAITFTTDGKALRVQSFLPPQKP